jgi:hypothetical protein
MAWFFCALLLACVVVAGVLYEQARTRGMVCIIFDVDPQEWPGLVADQGDCSKGKRIFLKPERPPSAGREQEARLCHLVHDCLQALQVFFLWEKPPPGVTPARAARRQLRLMWGWVVTRLIYNGIPEEQWRSLLLNEPCHDLGGTSTTIFFDYPRYGLTIWLDRDGNATEAAFSLRLAWGPWNF